MSDDDDDVIELGGTTNNDDDEEAVITLVEFASLPRHQEARGYHDEWVSAFDESEALLERMATATAASRNSVVLDDDEPLIINYDPPVSNTDVSNTDVSDTHVSLTRQHHCSCCHQQTAEVVHSIEMDICLIVEEDKWNTFFGSPESASRYLAELIIENGTFRSLQSSFEVLDLPISVSDCLRNLQIIIKSFGMSDARLGMAYRAVCEILPFGKIMLSDAINLRGLPVRFHLIRGVCAKCVRLIWSRLNRIQMPPPLSEEFCFEDYMVNPSSSVPRPFLGSTFALSAVEGMSFLSIDGFPEMDEIYSSEEVRRCSSPWLELQGISQHESGLPSPCYPQDIDDEDDDVVLCMMPEDNRRQRHRDRHLETTSSSSLSSDCFRWEGSSYLRNDAFARKEGSCSKEDYEAMPELPMAPKYLTCQLYPHQKKALWWMIEKETSGSLGQHLARRAAGKLNKPEDIDLNSWCQALDKETKHMTKRVESYEAPDKTKRERTRKDHGGRISKRSGGDTGDRKQDGDMGDNKRDEYMDDKKRDGYMDDKKRDGDMGDKKRDGHMGDKKRDGDMGGRKRDRDMQRDGDMGDRKRDGDCGDDLFSGNTDKLNDKGGNGDLETFILENCEEVEDDEIEDEYVHDVNSVREGQSEEKTHIGFWSRERSRAGGYCYRNLITGTGQKCNPRIPRGGILADEMGLGKTITALALTLLDEETQRRIQCHSQETRQRLSGLHRYLTRSVMMKGHHYQDPQRRRRGSVFRDEKTIKKFRKDSDNTIGMLIESLDTKMMEEPETAAAAAAGRHETANEGRHETTEEQRNETVKEGRQETAEEGRPEERRQETTEEGCCETQSSTDVQGFGRLTPLSRAKVKFESERGSDETLWSMHDQKKSYRTGTSSPPWTLRSGDGDMMSTSASADVLLSPTERVAKRGGGAATVRAQSDKPTGGGTLIVVPSSLLGQWADQLCKHAPRLAEVSYDHHNGTCIEKRDCKSESLSLSVSSSSVANISDPLVAGKFAVVLTTYEDLRRDAKAAKNKHRSRFNKMGSVFDLRWRRIILDEAHVIRNRTTITSKLVCGCLKGSARWCLTGTPMQNKVCDLYPYMRFLRVQPFSKFATFRDYFLADKNSHAWLRKLDLSRQDPNRISECRWLSCIVDWICLRRLKSMVLTTSECTTTTTLTAAAAAAAEEEIVNETEISPSKVLPKKHFIEVEISWKEGSTHQEFYRMCVEQAQSLLDQLTGSSRNQFDVFRMLTKLRLISNAPHLCGQDLYRQLQALVAIKKGSLSGRYVTASLHPNICQQLLAGSEGNPSAEQEEDLCAICLDPDNDCSTACGHRFHEICLKGYLAQKRGGKAPCPSCREPFTVNTLLTRSDAEKFYENGKLKEMTPPEVIVQETPSKLVSVKEILERRILNTDEKIVILSSFKRCVDMISNYLEDTLHVSHRTIHGGITPARRTEIIREFQNHPSIKVLIATIQTTGVGLNLTAANHVILFDPWWNPMVEDQAVGRVHRLGQTREVFVYRFVMKKTIEEQIYDTHYRKREQIHQMFDTHTNNDKERLTVSQVERWIRAA